MKRIDILDSIEDLSADDQAEVLTVWINGMESKFVEIRDLLENTDINSLDNILEAKNIAESMATDLY